MNRLVITTTIAAVALTWAQHSIAGGTHATGIGQAQSTAIQGLRNSSRNSTTINGAAERYQAPATFAPGLAAASIETCLGSVSIGASGPGGGLSFGTTTEDKPCQARLDARTLWAFGQKAAAIRRLCINPDMAAALGPDVCPVVQQQAPTIFTLFQGHGR